MMLDLAKQTEEIHGTANAEMKVMYVVVYKVTSAGFPT